MSDDSGRHSLRLENYDYTQPGYYHTIIGTQQGRHFFGRILDGEMYLNVCGQIALEALLSLPGRFACIELDTYVIMPNHVHAIIVIKELAPRQPSSIDQMPARFQSYWRALEQENPSPDAVPLYEVMRAFKALTTYHEHRKGQTPSFGWHSGYYERIIAEHERFLYNVRRYILNNPIKWDLQRQAWEVAGFRWARIPLRDAH
jgi:putative transposase